MGNGKLEPQQINAGDMAILPELTETGLLDAQRKAQAMQKPFNFVANPPSPDALTLALLKKIPLLSGFLRSLDSTGASLSKLATIDGHPVAETVGSGFQFASLFLALIDFVRIPIIFLAAWMLGVELPITLSKSARFIYSTVLLVLAVVGLVIPAAASPLALVTAGLGLGTAVFILGKHIYDHLQTKKALKNTVEEIKQAEAGLLSLQNKANELARLLDNPAKKAEYPVFAKQIDELQLLFESKTKETQALYDKQLNQTQLLATFWGRGLNKTVALILATIAFIGLVLSLFFPPVGLGLIAASAAVGGLYIIGRIGYALGAYLYEKLTHKPSQPNKADIKTNNQEQEVEQVLTKTPKSGESQILEQDPGLDSTSIAMRKLLGKKDVVALNAQIASNQHIEQIDKQLSILVKEHNLDGTLSFFKEMANHAKVHQSSPEDIRDFLDYFSNMTPAFILLNQALLECSLSLKDKAEMFEYEPLTRILNEKGVTNRGQIAPQDKDVKQEVGATKKERAGQDEGDSKNDGENLSSLY